MLHIRLGLGDHFLYKDRPIQKNNSLQYLSVEVKTMSTNANVTWKREGVCQSVK